jgi:myosin protein heavy chain
LAVEQENRTLRDSNFEFQSKARAAEAALKRNQSEATDKDKQLKIMTDQNAELLRLLEGEESQTAKLQREVDDLRGELGELRRKHEALLNTAKAHEEIATRVSRFACGRVINKLISPASRRRKGTCGLRRYGYFERKWNTLSSTTQS